MTINNDGFFSANSMDDYTKGMWRIGTYPSPLELAGAHDVCIDAPREGGLFILASCNQNFIDKARANARRIVACVNACDGVEFSSLRPGLVRSLLQATTDTSTALCSMVSSYRLPDGAEIVKTSATEAPETWAIRRNSNCLNFSLEWEYEPMPSNRDDEFLKRCRWQSADHAYKGWLAKSRKSDNSQ